MDKDQNHFQQVDRDLLIELRTQMKFLIEEIKDMKGGTKFDINKLQDRMEKLEKWKEVLTGKYTILAILGTAFIATIASLVTRFIIK